MMDRNSLEFKWNNWVLRARDILGHESVDLLCLSYLKDTSPHVSCNNKLLAIADRRKTEDDLSSLFKSTWWEDGEFRCNFLWRISQLGKEGNSCLQHLRECELEFDRSHTFSGAPQDSELCVSIFRGLLNLSGDQREQLKARLACHRHIHTEHVNSYTHLFKMMFNGRQISANDLTVLEGALREVKAPAGATKPLEDYCKKYGLSFEEYEHTEEATEDTCLLSGPAASRDATVTGTEDRRNQHPMRPVGAYSPGSLSAESGRHGDNEPEGSSRCSPRWKCVLILSIVLCSGIVLTAFLVPWSVLNSSQGSFPLLVGTTAIVDHVNSLSYSGWWGWLDHKHCPQLCEVQLFVERYHNLETLNSTKSCHNCSTIYHQEFPSLQSGLTRPRVFLLPGSYISYVFCAVSANDSVTQQGTGFVFNDLDHYFKYDEGLIDGFQASVDHWDIPIGPTGQWVCTTYNFTVKDASYIVVLANTPGGITFNYTYVLYSIYLDRSDYKEVCTVKFDQDCDNVTISPEGKWFHHHEYALLAYTEIPPVSAPDYTYLHFGRKINNMIYVYVAIGIVGIVCLVVGYFVLLLVL